MKTAIMIIMMVITTIGSVDITDKIYTVTQASVDGTVSPYNCGGYSSKQRLARRVAWFISVKVNFEDLKQRRIKYDTLTYPHVLQPIYVFCKASNEISYVFLATTKTDYQNYE